MFLKGFQQPAEVLSKKKVKPKNLIVFIKLKIKNISTSQISISTIEVRNKNNEIFKVFAQWLFSTHSQITFNGQCQWCDCFFATLLGRLDWCQEVNFLIILLQLPCLDHLQPQKKGLRLLLQPFS